MLELKFYPDPIFKQRAKLVEVFDQSILTLEKDFFEALEFYKALGIGANMLGILSRVIIVSCGNSTPIFMVNPVITPISEQKEFGEESSLSISGITLQIPRYQNINVQYQTSSGTKKIIEAQGLLARVIQHETDYLNGLTIFDHISETKKLLSLEKYKKLQKAKNRNMS